jgi:hypothetical protein
MVLGPVNQSYGWGDIALQGMAAQGSLTYGQSNVPGSRKAQGGKRWFSEPSNKELDLLQN